MECFNLSEKFVCYNIFIVIVGIVICVAIVVNVCSQSTISRLFTRLQKIKWNLILKKYSIPVLIFLIAFAGIKLFIDVFHDGNWLVTKDTCISKNISDWGNFATCIGAFFALISIYLAYRAFISQVNAARRASFDATFTQIFAQHKILYDKAMQHNNKVLFVSDYNRKCIKGSVNKNIFYICKNEYNEYINIIRTSSRNNDISEFWTRFNEQIGASVSVDFKNYLKYIHNEVEFVASQPDDILDNDAKQRYIQLIQAQMNNDELFCYLINKVEFMYRNKSNLEEDTRIHAEHLKDYKFFIELCRGKSGHVDLVEMMLRDKELNVSAFIDEKWILKDKS